jgi:hypothetical protein
VITKIEGPGSVRNTPSVRRATKVGVDGDAFAKELSDIEGQSAASRTSGSASLGLVSGVLGLQEVDDATARASRGKLRAENILDQLDTLKLDLLTGMISREKLSRLVRLVNSQRASVSDPKLASILDEIDLRAQVELAKYSHA